jgi:uncharacterized Zn finger protein
MGTSARLTEDVVRELSTKQSFARGLNLYRSGAISDIYRQGDAIYGECEGSSAPYYNVAAVIAGGVVTEATCNCPYDFGGLCKHIIALLLTYIHDPKQFEERLPVRDLVKDLDRAALVSLLERLASADPDLYDRIEGLSVRPAASADRSGKHAPPKSLSEISDKSYRRRIKSILRGPLSVRHSEQYWMTGRMIGELNEIHAKAVDALQAGDGATALVILMALLEETGEAYHSLDDSDGEIAGFIEEVSESISEAVLSQGLAEEDREILQTRLASLSEDFEGYEIYGIETALDAVEQGWDAALSLEDEEDLPSELTNVKLNILERQGRTDDFLALCLAEGQYWRYVYKLLELGRKDEALRMAEERLTTASEIYALARNLADRGAVDDALAVGERLLSMQPRPYSVAGWLAALAQFAGRKELAWRAYRVDFQETPGIEKYHKLRELAGEGWEQQKPELTAVLGERSNAGVLVDIYMEEGEWDAAIQIVDQGGWYVSERLPRLVEAVLELRPEWVIQVGKTAADQFIQKGSGPAYANAASWLRTVKKAYTVQGKQNEWREYLRDLKLQYPRRRVLQAELSKL